MRLPYFHFPHPTSRKYNTHSLTLVWPDGSYSTTDHVKEYLKSYMMPRAKDSAIQGDFVFHGPHRLMLKYRASKQPSWAFGTYLNSVLRVVFQRFSDSGCGSQVISAARTCLSSER